jgi:hypothetical protein
MVFEQIENLKRQYTDQFVVVDENRPELARFRGVTGQVKTINMNGRALVEFQDYIANIGWYDIELDFLKVVPKPDPAAAKVAAKPAAAKPVAKEPAAKAKPASPAPAKAASSKPAAGKMSTAEILAASRAKKATEATAAVAMEPATAPAKSAPKPAAAPASPTGSPAVGKLTTGKLSTTAEKIAACRQIDAKKS